MRIKVYGYLNLHQYLKDALTQLQAEGVSLRQFAKTAGLASHTHIKQVIEGKKKATLETVAKFGKGLGLTEPEEEFLELLLKFSQAESTEDKNHIYKKILKKRPKSAPHLLEEKFYHLYEQWYFLAVRELLEHPDFREDPRWIAKQLVPEIKPREAQRAMELLESAGFAVRNATGNLVLANPDTTTNREVKSLAIMNYHRMLIEMGRNSMQATPARFRDISSVSCLLDLEEFEFIKTRIQEFRREIFQYIKDRRDKNFPPTLVGHQKVLYFLNMQLFNGSVIPWRNRAATGDK